MSKKIIKYSIISLIGIYLISQLLPIGDYCSGLGNFINTLFIAGVLVLIVFILAIINLIQIKKRRFDFVPLIIAFFFITISYFLTDMYDKKFWTKKSLIGLIQIEGTPKSGTLELFTNGSFGASYHYADYSCTFQGDYEIIDNRLILKRTDLTELTDTVFTTEYLINRKDSILKPMKDGFKKIEVSKIIEE